MNKNIFLEISNKQKQITLQYVTKLFQDALTPELKKGIVRSVKNILKTSTEGKGKTNDITNDTCSRHLGIDDCYDYV